MTSTALWACHGQCLKLFDVSRFGPTVTQLQRFAILGNTVVVEAVVPNGAGYFTTDKRAYCIEFFEYTLSDPAPCDTNVWDTPAWPVCAVDETNNCERVMLLPRTTSILKIQTCGRNEGMLVGCASYDTERDFVYQASLTTQGIVSQSTLQQVDNTAWQVFMTTPPDQVCA